MNMAHETPAPLQDQADGDQVARWKRLRERLGQHRSQLCRRGSLASRRLRNGRRVWDVRFVDRSTGSRPVHRAIYVGSEPELVRRTRELLAAWRLEQYWSHGDRISIRVCNLMRQLMRPATG